MVCKRLRQSTTVFVKTLVMLSLAILVTVAPASAQKTTLIALTNGHDEYLESTRMFFDEVERRFPDIEIEIQLGSLDNFVVQAAAGTPPDLLRLYGQNVPEYAAKGFLLDLTSYIDSSSLVDADDFVPVILSEGLSYKGRIYSIPFGVSITTWFYNKDRFDEVGLTYPDFDWSWEVEGISAGKRLSPDLDGDGLPDRFFVTEAGGIEAYPYLYSAGGAIFSPDMAEFLGNSEENAAALDFIYELASVHQIMPSPGQPGGPFELLNGSTAVHSEGSWFVSLMQVAQPSFQWDMAPLPTLLGDRGTNVWPETPWAIPADTPNKEAAWKVLEFIGSVEGQRFASQLGLAAPPVRLSVASTDFAREFPQLDVSALITTSVLPYTKPLPTAPATARSLFDQVIREVRDGIMPARTALEEAAPRIQAELDEFIAGLDN